MQYQPEPNVRQADDEQYGQLIGGDEDLMMSRPVHHRAARQQQPVPTSDMMFGSHARDQFEDDEEAMMAKVIEESMANAHLQNRALSEEEELAQILEMSKNIK